MFVPIRVACSSTSLQWVFGIPSDAVSGVKVRGKPLDGALLPPFWAGAFRKASGRITGCNLI